MIVSIHLKTSEEHFAAGYAVIHVLSLNPLKTPSSLVPNACVSPTYPLFPYYLSLDFSSANLHLCATILVLPHTVTYNLTKTQVSHIFRICHPLVQPNNECFNSLTLLLIWDNPNFLCLVSGIAIACVQWFCFTVKAFPTPEFSWQQNARLLK